jgi:fatty acid desaturase
LQHLAHHQFVNDPDKDPDVAQMAASGHRFEFPMAPGQFLWECVIKQFLWLPNLVRYIRVRAKYNSTGGGNNPYQPRGKQSPLLVIVGLLYMASLIAAVWFLARQGEPLLLALVPACMWAGTVIFYALAPQRLFLQSLVKCDIPRRWATILRITHLTLVFTGLGWLSYLTDRPWGLYYLVLWMVPLFTTFSFFMILRQIVQHGNADTGRLSNTRVFHVNRLIQLAVFPLGMDWHLPHHLFPMVPHYRLKELHELLMEVPCYRDEAVVVDGYFFHREQPPQNPTVVDLMARANWYAPSGRG